jgi:carbonic anhydrase/acetyltransferase-like protein (isoleucine patch superfamily)
MAIIATSVTVVSGRHADAQRLDAAVELLRRRFPRAHVDRYLASLPSVGAGVLVAPGAALVGDVTLGDDSSVWWGAVLRGDIAPVAVVFGHRAMLHACRVEDGCLIGMQSTILDEAVIGHGSVVGAGALVTQQKVIPPYSLVLGSPARVVRKLTADDEAFHRAAALKYVRLKENYLRDSLLGS